MILKWMESSQVFLLGRLLNCVIILWVSIIEFLEIFLNRLVFIFGSGLLLIDWWVMVCMWEVSICF